VLPFVVEVQFLFFPGQTTVEPSFSHSGCPKANAGAAVATNIMTAKKAVPSNKLMRLITLFSFPYYIYLTRL
jgi:hypothetical protein